jgi:hypothetical protein
MPEKLFTLEEATRLLPVVRQLILEIQSGRDVVEQRSQELERLLSITGGNGHLTADIAAMRQAIQEAAESLQRLMAELDELGVELKGIDDGLVDFRSERDGRVVYLCWRLGEDAIAYWHELETGFAGRQPL